jgi:hypothetical protein
MKWRRPIGVAMNLFAAESRDGVACCREVPPAGQARLHALARAAAHKNIQLQRGLCVSDSKSVKLLIIKLRINKIFHCLFIISIFRQNLIIRINPPTGGGNAGKQLLQFFVRCSPGAGGAQPPVAARLNRYTRRKSRGYLVKRELAESSQEGNHHDERTKRATRCGCANGSML